jgi:hypothetical protein
VKQHETSANRLQELQWDPDARLFWLKNFGSDTMVVSWQQFIKAMGSSIYVSPEDANNLKRIVGSYCLEAIIKPSDMAIN